MSTKRKQAAERTRAAYIFAAGMLDGPDDVLPAAQRFGLDVHDLLIMVMNLAVLKEQEAPGWVHTFELPPSPRGAVRYPAAEGQ